MCGCSGLSIYQSLVGQRVETISLGKGHRRASYDHHHVQLSAQLWEGRFWDVNVLLFDFQGHM